MIFEEIIESCHPLDILYIITYPDIMTEIQPNSKLGPCFVILLNIQILRHVFEEAFWDVNITERIDLLE